MIVASISTDSAAPTPISLMNTISDVANAPIAQTRSRAAGPRQAFRDGRLVVSATCTGFENARQ